MKLIVLQGFVFGERLGFPSIGRCFKTQLLFVSHSMDRLIITARNLSSLENLIMLARLVMAGNGLGVDTLHHGSNPQTKLSATDGAMTYFQGLICH